VYKPLLWVGDWYATLLSAATHGADAAARADASRALRPLLESAAGGDATDSIDHWQAMVATKTGGGGEGAGSPPPKPPRGEILLAGVDNDKQGAAIRVGPHKLLVGAWGDPRHCDLNVSGMSPAFPAPPDSGGLGGEGGLWCMDLPPPGTPMGTLRAVPPPPVGAPVPPWWESVHGLYDVEADPRELHDLQHDLPDVAAKLLGRLLSFRASTVPSVHLPEDPNGTAHANRTHCWSPWR
jgi:hypothetical protein